MKQRILPRCPVFSCTRCTTKIVLVFLATMLLSHLSTAQKILHGVVLDTTGKPVSGATIQFAETKNASRTTTVSSDDNGMFQIALHSDSLHIQVTHVDYEDTVVKTKITASDSSLVIRLVPKKKTLDAVTITAVKKLIEQKPDRTILNVDASILGKGTSATELLNLLPGISLDRVRGIITYLGRNGLQIQINGKPARIGGEDLINYLTSLPSDHILRIEFLSSPGANQEAAGNAGIINIVLRSATAHGLSGNSTSTYTQGRYPKWQQSLNVFFRTPRSQYSLLVSGSLLNDYHRFNSQRRFPAISNEPVMLQNDLLFTKTANINAALYTNHLLRDSAQLSFQVAYQNNHRSGNKNSFIKYQQNTIENFISNNLSFSKQQTAMHTEGITFQKRYTGFIREFSIAADHSVYNRHSFQHLYSVQKNEQRAADSLVSVDLFTPSRIHTFAMQAAIKQTPLWNMEWEEGIKYAYVATENSLLYDTLLVTNRPLPGDQKDRFIYSDKIMAAYILLKYNKNANLFQMGLRGELTNWTSESPLLRRKAQDTYFQIFPTLVYQYSFTSGVSLRLGLNKRIDRPNYQELNPFVLVANPWQTFEGNTKLQPQITTNMEAGLSYKNIQITLSRSRTRDRIVQISEQIDSLKLLKYYPINIGRSKTNAVNIFYSAKISGAVSAINNLSVYKTSFLADDLLGGDLRNSRVTFRINTTLQVKLSGKSTMELNGFYRSHSVVGIYTFRPNYVLTCGFQSQLWNEKLTVRLSVVDILHSDNSQAYYIFQNQDIVANNQWDTRNFRLSLIYNFGNTPAMANKRQGTDEEIKKRVD